MGGNWKGDKTLEQLCIVSKNVSRFGVGLNVLLGYQEARAFGSLPILFSTALGMPSDDMSKEQMSHISFHVSSTWTMDFMAGLVSSQLVFLQMEMVLQSKQVPLCGSDSGYLRNVLQSLLSQKADKKTLLPLSLTRNPKRKWDSKEKQQEEWPNSVSSRSEP